jgi:hypothetical protein
MSSLIPAGHRGSNSGHESPVRLPLVVNSLLELAVVMPQLCDEFNHSTA